MQVPKYGEIRNGGTTFFDTLTELQIDLPPAKAMKLKKDQRYPWVFWFAQSHEVAKPGDVNPHVIDVLWHQDDYQDADILVRCFAALFNMNMNFGSGVSAKFDQPEKVAEAYFKDMTTSNFVEVKNGQPPKKTKFGRGLDAYLCTWEGREKAAVENHAKFVSEGQKPKEEPPVWEMHLWAIKGKARTFVVQVQTRPGVWKARQREIDILLKLLKIPS